MVLLLRCGLRLWTKLAIVRSVVVIFGPTMYTSERDVAIQIPINFIPHPAVALRAACFAEDRYEDASAQKCLSNLLATGFRRIIVDLYWNPFTSQWTLCPAALPSLNQSSTSAQSSTVSTISSSSSQLFQASTNLSLIRSVLQDHFVITGTNVDATLKYLILNLHNATLYSGTDSAQLESTTPQSVAQILNATLSSYLYTPINLAAHRANLNSSWLSVPVADQVDISYFHYSINATGFASSPDGWPNEGYAELNEAKRLLVGFGMSDFSDTQYNASADESLIFATGTLFAPRPVTLASNGSVISGCIFDDSEPASVAKTNNSFALAIPAAPGSASPTGVDDSASSLALCGFSPLLNTTLNNNTADAAITPYTTFVTDSLWAWYPGQPDDKSSGSASNNARCAVMNISAPAGGRWQVAPCAGRFPGACRIGSAPFEWTLTDQRGSYDAVNHVCPPNSTFAVPRTPIENAYLRATAVETLSSSDADPDSESHLVWINLNDLDIGGCWVTGVNARCPYNTNQASASRHVIVPTVAAVIVFCIAALTILGKCAARRQGAERWRRRMRIKDGLGEYEGVPS
ncbi:hypothetical protein ANO11243_001950 [Dothideomycetidae sp. 11243]|nr:hypothetical protein ANO11243_001950 [fungal sp. No.11243]